MNTKCNIYNTRDPYSMLKKTDLNISWKSNSFRHYLHKLEIKIITISLKFPVNMTKT